MKFNGLIFFNNLVIFALGVMIGKNWSSTDEWSIVALVLGVIFVGVILYLRNGKLIILALALLVSCSPAAPARRCPEWATYHWLNAPPAPRLAGLTVVTKCAAIEGEGSLVYFPSGEELLLQQNSHNPLP